MRARLIPFPLELALLTVALGVAVATSEFEFADSDPLGPRASSFATIPTPPLPPAALVRSTVHPETNMRVDTFLKPLGNLTKGRVLNTRPWGAAGRLARPDPDGDDPILIARVAFDIVHGDTLESLPLDRAYNHHLVIYSRPEPSARRRGTRARRRPSLRAASALSSPAEAPSGAAPRRTTSADMSRSDAPKKTKTSVPTRRRPPPPSRLVPPRRRSRLRPRTRPTSGWNPPARSGARTYTSSIFAGWRPSAMPCSVTARRTARARPERLSISTGRRSPAAASRAAATARSPPSRPTRRRTSRPFPWRFATT